MTHDFFLLQKVPEKSQKVQKNAHKWLKRAQKCRKVSKRRDFLVLVLLSTHAERVGVSRMQDFLIASSVQIYSNCAGVGSGVALGRVCYQRAIPSSFLE